MREKMEEINQVPNEIEIEMENPNILTPVREVLDGLSPLSSSCCIYRVPDRLRRSNEKAYTPQVVSIGPLHHGKEHLKAMEEHKYRYLQDYLRRANISLEDAMKKIKDQEERLRGCYAEPIKFDSDKFVTIILVDAAFIIEVLLKWESLQWESFQRSSRAFVLPDNDRIFNKPGMLTDVWPDLRMLENQLPFFILEDLCHPGIIPISFSNTTEGNSLINCVRSFFIAGMEMKATKDYLEKPCSGIEHFVDLCRYLFLELPVPAELKPQLAEGKLETSTADTADTPDTAPSVTELHQAGVKFKKARGRNLLDIRFTDGVLEIPKLTVNGQTELTFRNLVAFEECHYKDQRYITEYVSLMDFFVNTPKDVDLLVENNIVKNLLGDNSQVSTIFNNLAERIFLNLDDDYATLRRELNKHCNRSWNKWKANLRQNYCNTPWATISVIAAIVLVILSLIQTVFSIIDIR